MSDPPLPPSQYQDDALVYVDPESRTVVGPVEWSRSGYPKPKLMPEREPKKEKGEERRRGNAKRYYPWGTYRSMKRIYQLEGKLKKVEPHLTLDEAMVKALKEAYWD